MALTVAVMQVFLQSAITEIPFVANDFAADDPNECAYVRLTGGAAPSEWTSKSHPGIQIIVRSKSAVTAETIANAVYDELHGRSEFTLGDIRVVKCLSGQSMPWYAGKDENDRVLYSLSFTLTTIE